MTSSGTRSPSSLIGTADLESSGSEWKKKDQYLESRRPRSETMPSSNMMDWSSEQLLKGDDINTIASTFSSLGLDEHSYSSTSTNDWPSLFRFQHNNRPRAQSAVDQQQQQPSIQNIWTPSKPFLRTSNSSADLLEMMARQRRPNVIHHDQDTTGDLEDMNQSLPSKTLWLGQVDQSYNDLYAIFVQFGVIEHIRLLPEKKMAFVHFSTVEEAINAKDTLVNTMNSRLYPHALHPVKVGFGKLDQQASPIILPNENLQEPTRALWVGNIPINTTQAALNNLFSCYGMIESVRVLSNKNCGFINYYSQEDAIKAKRAFQNKEILGPGTGFVKIGFAKVPSLAGGLVTEQQQQHHQHQQQPMLMIPEEEPMLYMMNNANVISALITERKIIMQEFGEDDTDGPTFDGLHFPQSYYHTIPAAPELGQTRKVDISRLRDIRKRLDNGTITVHELEMIAIECVDELVELCSDYIGNTIIQRLFERCSEVTKSIMLEAVAPYLASIGVHKNGTWAAQKIIDTARLPPQIALICAHIKPFVPALLLDQFGNYVVQCCLGLGPTRNQFIFDAIVDSCWEIAQGRFGARAVRATLESPHVTKRQQKYVAAALVQHALLLATNANGALLLIWLLDTSGIPGRYRVLAPRLLPHLSKLCVHKLASLTVLKLINQRQEPEARSILLDALFFSHSHTSEVPHLIDHVLRDQVHGVSLVQKVLSSSYIELRERQKIAERVKQYLYKLKLQHVQGYKRLMEEINMVMVDSTPSTTIGVPLPTQFPISPGLAAALQATYLPQQSLEDEDNRINNFYAAAAAAAAAATTNTNSTSPTQHQ